MTNLFTKTVLAAALAASALAGSAPAMADGYRGDYHHGGGGAGVAVAAGVFGLALGAVIASSAHHDDREYAPQGYYGTPYVEQNWQWHNGYYWDRDGNRYGRDGRSYGHEYRGYDHDGYGHDGYGHDGYGHDGYGHGYGYHGDPREYHGGYGY